MHRPLPALTTPAWLYRLPLLLLLASSACTGEFDRPSGPAASADPNADASGMSSDSCLQQGAAPMRAHLLSPSQYANAVQEVLHVSIDLSTLESVTGSGLDELGVERRANAAEDIARRAASAYAAWAPCTPATADASACGLQISAWLGRRAFRRPLEDAELQNLYALFSLGLTEGDFALGVEWLLTGLLQTPDFLYQVAQVRSDEPPLSVQALSSYELLSRLTLSLWDSIPDDAALDEAAQAGFMDDAAYRDRVKRMLNDKRFARGVERFYQGWLSLDGFADVARDDPEFTGEVVQALRESLRQSIRELYADAQPSLRALFTGNSYFVNPALRAFYKLPASQEQGFVRTPFEGEERYGLLTHPALLTLLARPSASHPIARGLFVRRKLLCQEIPPPPDGLTIPPLAAVDANASTREQLSAHTDQPVCAGCHDRIDPPGFALEAYDFVGRQRATDGNRPVDTSGVMRGAADLDGPFAHGGELLARIAQSKTVATCFARTYFAHGLERDVGEEDACSLAQTTDAFVESGDLRELAAAVVLSSSFRTRAAEARTP